MLNRTVSYKVLLRIIGGCFLFYGLYMVVLALTAQISVGGSYQYNGPWIFDDPNGVRNYIFCGGLFLANPLLPTPPGGALVFGPFAPGPLLWASVGMLLLSITSRRVNVVYVCLQVALWLISLSIWFPLAVLFGITDYEPASFVPFELVTLALSLILLLAYWPVTYLLRKLYGSDKAAPVARI